ncbi:MAG: protein-L-isoaspartate(D-aspartate) O-methyltransferase [Thermoanaerobaculia bacterium]
MTWRSRDPFVPPAGAALLPCLAAAAFLLLGCRADAAAGPRGDDPYAEERARMVEAIRSDVAETAREVGKKRLDPEVLDALRAVPRHEFVPERLRDAAYRNRPLPIGHGQTISQPYMVAIMTDLLEVDGDDRVFELGTGSGYQAAVLAELVEHVYTVEIVPELAREADARLERLGYDDVTARQADGYFGWEEHAPFDAIVVTAAASHVPPPLIEQLAPGGRMVIPVGSPFATQQLMLVEKTADGEIHSRQLLPVAFVPLTREEGDAR